MRGGWRGGRARGGRGAVVCTVTYGAVGACRIEISENTDPRCGRWDCFVRFRFQSVLVPIHRFRFRSTVFLLELKVDHASASYFCVASGRGWEFTKRVTRRPSPTIKHSPVSTKRPCHTNYPCKGVEYEEGRWAWGRVGCSGAGWRVRGVWGHVGESGGARGSGGAVFCANTEHILNGTMPTLQKLSTFKILRAPLE